MQQDTIYEPVADEYYVPDEVSKSEVCSEWEHFCGLMMILN